MKKTLMAVALAFGVGAWAADTARVTVPGGATADYNSLQAALNAYASGLDMTYDEGQAEDFCLDALEEIDRA